MKELKFWGYRRPDGKVGIRNHVLVVASVGCATEVAKKIADNVYGAVSFINQNGCGETLGNLKKTQDILIGMACNPNVYGTIVVGLGCELNQLSDLLPKIRERTCKPVEGFTIQEIGGTVNAVSHGTRLAQQMAIAASMCRQEEIDISELILGVECGGSDATSGLIANPVMGLVSDRITKCGGTAMFSETLEMVGAEHLLAKRACNPELGQRILDTVHRREAEQAAAGEDLRKTQPSPGNKDGGITTLEEKSLGCIHKGGHGTIMDMLECAQPPAKKGLLLMDTPCYDPISTTAKVAAGCQLIVFTTGRGNSLSNPIAPVLKVTANHETFMHMNDNMDIDMSSVLDGSCTLEAMAEETMEIILDTLNGKLTKAEALRLGYSEVVVSRLCEYV